MLSDRARAAAEEYTRSRTRLGAALERLADLEVPLDPVDGLPPPWSGEQHAAIVEASKAFQDLVIARSRWVASRMD